RRPCARAASSLPGALPIFPEGGGWRVRGRERSTGSRRHAGHGYDFVHAAVDDRSRPAYAEILPDERKDTASASAWRERSSTAARAEEHTSELQPRGHLVCR